MDSSLQNNTFIEVCIQEDAPKSDTSDLTNLAITLCKNYGFDITFDKTICYAVGIGDLLYIILGIKNNIIQAPAAIGMTLLVNVNKYFSNPLNILTFRLQMLCDILHANNMPKSSIVFAFGNNLKIREPAIYKSLHLLHLEVPPMTVTPPTVAPYIVIHTKIRHDRLTHNRKYPYEFLKVAITEFGKQFKTDHTIILLGEQEITENIETNIHKIQSCYAELLQLSANNTLIDLTTPRLDTLNYGDYKKDVGLIANAAANISFGSGGSFCTAMTFGKCIYAYSFVKYNPDTLKAHDSHIYADYNQMIADITERFGAKA